MVCWLAPGRSNYCNAVSSTQQYCCLDICLHLSLSCVDGLLRTQSSWTIVRNTPPPALSSPPPPFLPSPPLPFTNLCLCAQAYTDVKQLRYGHLMIMTDQDHDGSHIKGLIMNYFHTFYPSLMRLPGFLIEFITPVIKVSTMLASSKLLLCQLRDMYIKMSLGFDLFGILQHGVGFKHVVVCLPTLSDILSSSFATQQALSW